MDNSDLIDKFIKFHNMGHADCLKQLLELYPEFTEEVDDRLNSLGINQKKRNNFGGK